MKVLWQWLDATIWRRTVNGKFKKLTDNSGITLDIDNNKLWQNIESTIDEQAPPERLNRRRSFSLVAAIATAALLGIVIVQENMIEESTIKGPAAETKPERQPILRFAVMDQSGELTHGHAQMTIERQSRIIFSLAEPMGQTFKPYKISISVEKDREIRSILESYQVLKANEILSRQQKIISLKLEEPGLYRFSGKKYANGKERSLRGFDVQVK